MKEEDDKKRAGSKMVNVSDLDENFKYELAKMPGGEKITRCFQCGTCTAGCPVVSVNEKYNPRRIIRMALLGMKDEVIKEPFVWLCSTCYTCTERCPQDVRITDLMFAIKNYAVEHGYVHPAFKTQAELLRDQGRLYPVEEFENKRRAKQDLPELPESDDSAERIMEASGLLDLLGEGEGQKEEDSEGEGASETPTDSGGGKGTEDRDSSRARAKSGEGKRVKGRGVSKKGRGGK